MTQQELNQQIARHTGESIREISRRGFSELRRSPVRQREEPDEDSDDLLFLMVAMQQDAADSIRH